MNIHGVEITSGPGSTIEHGSIFFPNGYGLSVARPMRVTRDDDWECPLLRGKNGAYVFLGLKRGLSQEQVAAMIRDVQSFEGFG